VEIKKPPAELPAVDKEATFFPSDRHHFHKPKASGQPMFGRFSNPAIHVASE
jgi:hypothetical protein